MFQTCPVKISRIAPSSRPSWRVGNSATIASSRYVFGDLKTLLAKASPARSGDQLAGIAAASGEERVAAQYALADVLLASVLEQPVAGADLGGGDVIAAAVGAERGVKDHPEPGSVGHAEGLLCL